MTPREEGRTCDMTIACPLECGYEGRIDAGDASGLTIFVCPECLGVAFDGGILTDPRKLVEVSRVIRPIVVATVHENSIDPLTQVKNRRFFFNRLATELRNARHRHYVSVIAFAIDQPALYRSAGARGGDIALQSLAAALLTALRAGDNFARVEPGVFGLILPHADEARAQEVADRVLATAGVHQCHDHNGKPVKVKLRYAMAQAGDNETPELLWKRVLEEATSGA